MGQSTHVVVDIGPSSAWYLPGGHIVGTEVPAGQISFLAHAVAPPATVEAVILVADAKVSVGSLL